jgi:hypothetical protein
MKKIFSNLLIFIWNLEMNSDLELARELISNTDRINRSFNLVPIDFEIIENKNGGSLLFGKSISSLGVVQ